MLVDSVPEGDIISLMRNGSTVLAGIYSASAVRLYRSVDAGATWEKGFSKPRTDLSLARDYQLVGNTVYAASGYTGFISGDSAVFSTTDLGKTWKPEHFGKANHAQVLYLDGTTLYAGLTRDGLFSLDVSNVNALPKPPRSEAIGLTVTSRGLRINLPRSERVAIQSFDLSGRALDSRFWELPPGDHLIGLPIHRGMTVLDVSWSAGSRRLLLPAF